MSKLRPEVDDVVPAGQEHGGFVRIVIGQYLGPAAEPHLAGIAQNIGGLQASLIAERHLITLEASPNRRYTNRGDLRRLARSFMVEVIQWWNNLDDERRHVMIQRPDVSSALSISSHGTPTGFFN